MNKFSDNKKWCHRLEIWCKQKTRENIHYIRALPNTLPSSKNIYILTIMLDIRESLSQ